MPISLRRPLLDTSKKYLLRDLFQGDAAAGTLNGTPASGGPGTRTVVDTESKLSVVGGVLSFAGGKASPGYDDPLNSYALVNRVAGRLLLFRVNEAAGATQFRIGFSNTAGGGACDRQSFLVYPTVLWVVFNSSTGVQCDALVAGTNYDLCIVVRGGGAFYFIKGGAFPNWSLAYAESVNSDAALYPSISNYSAVFTADNIRIPTQLFLPVPLASDGFSAAATDGLGHAEANGGNGLVWTGATWTVAAGAVTNSPTLGSELVVNGDFSAWTADNPDGWTLLFTEDANNYVAQDAGKARFVTNGSPLVNIAQNVFSARVWFQISINVISGATGGFAIFLAESGISNFASLANGTHTVTYRTLSTNSFTVANANGPADIVLDDVSVKPLTLSTLFRSLAVSTPDVLAEAAVTLTAGTQAGLVLNLDDAANPANFVIAYHNGTNCLLEKCVAGVYTTVISAAATYSAGAVLRVIKDGTAYRLYYNNALVGTGTISDAGIVSNARHGLFSTYASNSFDNFVIMARGTGNEYSALDTF